jgi:hypothetical protein
MSTVSAIGDKFLPWLNNIHTNRCTTKTTIIVPFVNTGHTQKNGAVSKVNTKWMSHITRAQHTPSAAATVQVSDALPAARFSCLLRGRGASFKDGVAAGEGFLGAPFWGVLLQMETRTFSLGHPVRQILHHAISFFGGSLQTAFMYHHCPRPSMKFVIG